MPFRGCYEFLRPRLFPLGFHFQYRRIGSRLQGSITKPGSLDFVEDIFAYTSTTLDSGYIPAAKSSPYIKYHGKLSSATVRRGMCISSFRMWSH